MEDKRTEFYLLNRGKFYFVSGMEMNCIFLVREKEGIMHDLDRSLAF